MGKPKAKVDGEKCLACSGCISICPQDAISMGGGRAFVICKNLGEVKNVI